MSRATGKHANKCVNAAQRQCVHKSPAIARYRSAGVVHDLSSSIVRRFTVALVGAAAAAGSG